VIEQRFFFLTDEEFFIFESFIMASISPDNERDFRVLIFSEAEAIKRFSFLDLTIFDFLAIVYYFKKGMFIEDSKFNDKSGED
jgi:hypothetical protein